MVCVHKEVFLFLFYQFPPNFPTNYLIFLLLCAKDVIIQINLKCILRVHEWRTKCLIYPHLYAVSIISVEVTAVSKAEIFSLLNGRHAIGHQRLGAYALCAYCHGQLPC